jgi:hypothetical protein
MSDYLNEKEFNMSLPGFTASNCLAPTVSKYYGGRSLSIEPDDLVKPQFLGVVREAFQKATPGFITAGSSLGKLLSSMRGHGGPGNTPWVCGQWATSMITCNGNSPAYSQSQMMANCITNNATDPTLWPLCTTASAGMYPLVQQFCAQGGGDNTQLLGQICQGN